MTRPSRGLLAFSALLLLAGVGLIVDRCVWAWVKDWAHEGSAAQALLRERHARIPNAQHVWWSDDLFFAWRNSGPNLLPFGSHFLAMQGDWSKLCSMDSNRDGLTNGQHLGDPCCRWRPSRAGARGNFMLRQQNEYRRWHLTHPSEGKGALLNMNATLALADSPEKCVGDYDLSSYNDQFMRFYFHRAHDAAEDTPYNVAKLLCLACMLGVIVHWAYQKHLLVDMFPWLATPAERSSWQISLLVCVLSFVYMDLTSGVIHLILDYAPFYLPGLGILAKGFQFHHQDPTAIIRISWYAYASHIHFLCPVVLFSVWLGDGSRLLRLFWVWGGFWAHLFQTAHRWAHMPPEFVPQVVQALQSTGLLLTSERHMLHHQDLESQFTILSGHTDLVLDSLSGFVPAARYDLWFLFGACWFLIPTYLDVCLRQHSVRLMGSDGSNIKQMLKTFPTDSKAHDLQNRDSGDLADKIL